jgi:hypothetical protein
MPLLTGANNMQHDSNAFDFTAYGGRDYGVESPTVPSTTTTTAKQTARAMRVWLENKGKLEASGFYAGKTYTALYGAGVVVLTLDATGSGKVSSCKRGDTVRPIIDLHNGKVATSFTGGAALLVTYSAGSITIKQQA